MSALFMRQSSKRETPSIRDRTASDRRNAVAEESPKQSPRAAEAGFFDSRVPSVRISIPEEEKEQTPRPVRKPERGFLKKLKSLYDKYGLSRVVPILLLVLYTLLGAGVFSAIERDNELAMEKESSDNMEKLRQQATDKLINLVYNPPPTYNTLRNASYDLLLWYEWMIPELNQSSKMSWDMWGALFYVGTIYTTIGYGNTYPHTVGGQIFTMIYAIFGIPLVLSILNDLGKLLCRWGNLAWFKLCQLRKRLITTNLRRKCGNHQKSQSPSNSTHASTSSFEAKMKLDEIDDQTMPIALSLFMCFGWMLICSGIFCIWETQWNYFTSFYFFFISLSTIGLGDVTPDHPKKMIFAFGFVIIGLSLVSMTINVIQQKIEAYLYKMMQRIQDEYRRALEMGEGPEKDEILARIMKDQPWYMQKLMPAMMGERQKEQLEHHIEEQVQITSKLSTNTKMVQTDQSNITKCVDTDVQVEAETEEVSTSPPILDWLMDKSMECAPEMMDKSLSPRAQDWLVDASMECAPEMMDKSISQWSQDWLMDRSMECAPQMTDQAVSPRSPDWLMDRSMECAPVMMDEAVSPRPQDWLVDRSMEFAPQMLDKSISPNPNWITSTPVVVDKSTSPNPDWNVDDYMESTAEMMDKSISPNPYWVMDNFLEDGPDMVDKSISPRPRDWLMDRSMEYVPQMEDANTQMSPEQAESKRTQTNQVTFDETAFQTSFIQFDNEKPETSDNVMQTSNIETFEKQAQIGSGHPQIDEGIQVDTKPTLLKRQNTVYECYDQGSQTDAKTEVEGFTQTNVECLVITLPRMEDSLGIFSASSGGGDTSEFLETTASQTESSASDIEIQTDDSYLKRARRLNALQTNRAQSLAVLALPKEKPKSNGPPPDDQITKNGAKEQQRIPAWKRQQDESSSSASNGSTTKLAQNGHKRVPVSTKGVLTKRW